MKYVFGILIAAACGVSLAAQSPTQSTAGQSGSSQAQSVTVTGCLVAGLQSSGTPGQPGQPGGFMLTGVTQNGAVSPTANSVSSSYALAGGKASDLRTYSNTRVEIQGTIQPAGTAAGQTGTGGIRGTTPPASTPPTATPPAGTPPTATPPAGTPPIATPPAGTPSTAMPPSSAHPAGTPPTTPSPTTPSPTGTSGTTPGSPTAATGQVPMQQLQITSVKQVPGMCGGGH